MSIFRETSYKAALKAALAKLQSAGASATMASLAVACNVQRSYLSKVFNQDGHFNSDQLFLACKFLRLSVSESRYVSLLMEAERSVLGERKEIIEHEIQRIRFKHLRTENYIGVKSPEARDEQLRLFRLDPVAQLVHMFMTVRRYSKSIKLIQKDLHVSDSEMKRIIDLLVNAGLAHLENNIWRTNSSSLHLSQDSEIYPAYRLLMRLKALEKLQSDPTDDTYSFSVVMSAEPATKDFIHEAFLEFLKKIEIEVKKAEPVEVYQINFDILRWSGQL